VAFENSELAALTHPRIAYGNIDKIFLRLSPIEYGEQMMKQSLRGPALYKAVRDYIKEYILKNDLKPGDPLPPEGKLVQDLGVGRSSVREAVKSLQSLGIIEVRQGNGLFVRELNFDPMLETFLFGMQFNPHTLAELLQVRTWIETAVIGDAVEHIRVEDLSKLDSILKMWEERVRDGMEYSDLDESFHQTIYGVLGNQTLMNLFSVFWIVFGELENEVKHDPDPQGVLTVHRSILDAIKAHDPALTRRRLIEHFASIKVRTQKYLESNL
jgi:DNA-binding FadR family transcriptional regulator